MDTDSAEALYQWARDGHGLTLRSINEARDNLMDGRLEAVLQDQMPTDRAYYAVYPQRQIMPTKLNAFIDFILETYGPSPSWSEPL
jgi:DNA-binding transcriptional LysR family regulator